ncbi:hypothetical protein FACS1894105_03880 [Clostridia bacterium]|nr:hypothetical protein FACS1894105_03880 [Clostridia bacterium]
MKTFLINLIEAFLLFTGFLISDTYLIYNTPNKDFSMVMVTMLVWISVAIVVVFSLITSASFARAYNKKVGVYLKRSIEQIFIIFLTGTAMTLLGGVIGEFMVGIAINTGDPIIGTYIIGIPSLVIFLIFLYGFYYKIGYSDATNVRHNMNFKIVTTILSFIIPLPFVIHDSIYLTLCAPYTALVPGVDKIGNVHEYFEYGNVNNWKFSLPIVVIALLLAFIIIAFVIIFAYKKAKSDLRKRLHDENFAADEAITYHSF